MINCGCCTTLYEKKIRDTCEAKKNYYKSADFLGAKKRRKILIVDLLKFIWCAMYLIPVKNKSKFETMMRL